MNNLNHKKIKVALMLLFILSILSIAASAQDTLKIKTSTKCHDCKDRIEEYLSFEKGVKYSNVDYAAQTVYVVIDTTKTNAEKIRQAIVKTGYDADTLLADQKAHNKLPKCCQKDHGTHHD